MTTFTYRDLRLQRVTDALAALPEGQDALRDRLQREQQALAAEDWTDDDRTLLAVAEDWLSNTRAQLKSTVDADPVFLALGTTSSLTDEQAAAIEGLPQAPGGPPADYLEQVRAAIGGDDATMTELVHAAYSAWLDPAAGDLRYPFDDVAVLLPLRLETLFDAPGSPFNDDPERWKLSLRVVPDEASICRDDDHVSAGELTAVRAFWAAARGPGPVDPGWLDGDPATVAWEMLCKQVTPARAAWLVAKLVPEIDGDALVLEQPVGMPTEPRPNRVGGLPPHLSVWAATRDADDVIRRHAVGRLPMDERATISADALTLPLPGAADGTRDAWWASWTTALKVGLAGEWQLEAGLTPDSLEALYVVGIGDEPPDDHFRAQVDSGELGVLRLGAPTNTVHGAPAADLATDAEGWRVVAKARLGQRLGRAVGTGTAGTSIERQLTGSSGVLPAFPGADSPDDTRDSQRIAQALWPALLGHWLADLWEVGDDAFRANLWAFPPADDSVPAAEEIKGVLHRPCEEPETEMGAANFCPEGPLMPLRIGDQPYGLLPVTALSQWQPDEPTTAEQQEQRRVEGSAARTLAALRGEWADAARRSGTVVGASSDRFMELLSREALSGHYIERSFLPASAWAAPYQLGVDDLSRFDELVRALYGRVREVVGTLPGTLYLTNGFWRPTELPLVQPWVTVHRLRGEDQRGRVPLTRFLALFVDSDEPMDLAEVFSRWWVLDQDGEFQLRVLPNSLLIRLLVHACQINADWRRTQAGGELALRVLKAQCEAVRAISCELDQSAWNQDDRDPETGEPRFVITIPDARRAQLERALRATLDSAAHRIDPWVTGFAWQRLKTHSASRRHTHRLGAYGWVDGPFLGEPGPTEAGRLHTPSYNQTLAAVVLRDKFLSSGRAASANQSGSNPWAMNISSRKARLAEEIADEVRLGFHIYEIVGRHVEDVVADHQLVRRLRTSPTYAMRVDRLDPNEVCNGIEALKGLLAGDPQLPLDDDQTAGLQAVHDALDTYSDLLMADGVMQLVNRQADRAAETMDAAAGFSRPPTFEFLRTPPSGYQLHTLVLTAVPYVAVGDVAADASPVRIADPSLASFVEETVGDDWTWTALNRDDGTEVASSSLADLGLVPIDTLTLSADFLSELVRHTLGLPLVFVTEGHARKWIVKDAAGGVLGVVTSTEIGVMPADLAGMGHEAVLGLVRTRVGAPPDSVVEEGIPPDPRLWVATDEHGGPLGLATVETLGLTAEEATASDEATLHRKLRQALGLADTQIVPPIQHTQVQHLAAALGNRPAAGRDLTQDENAQPVVDAAVYQELTDRYVALHAAGRTLVADLRAADEVSRASLLRRAVSWGATPVSEPADREALFAALSGNPPPAGATPAAELGETVARALEERLDAAAQPAELAPAGDLSAPLADHEQRKRSQHPDGVPTLAEAIANLAAPQVKLAITACWQRSSLLADTQLEVAHNEATLDETWLTVMAAVRPALARLEALQLGLDTPLEAWSSSPGDPFLTGADKLVKQNLKNRRDQSVLQMALNERFVTAYGRPDAWAGAKVAVGLLDSFSEAIPMPQRSTSAAFGFNAPAARAPQAILLAVPPRPRQRIDEDVVVQIVAETRELAHARTSHVEDLGDLQSLTPTIWLQSSGPSEIRLEPYPLFT